MKGYGPTFSPLDSARLKERVGMYRIEYGTEQFRMHRVSGPTRGCESGELERRVQQSLKQLGKKYNGARLCKEYQGTLYEGSVISTVWSRSVGYGVQVIYSDGFRERLSLQELQSLLLKIREPEVCNNPPRLKKEQTLKGEILSFWDVMVQREFEQTYLGKWIKKAFRNGAN